MQTKSKPKQKANAKNNSKAVKARSKSGTKPAKISKTPPAEQSVGIRICALSLVLLLVLASASYVPTQPVAVFIYAMTAIAGSYLAYAFRNNRPAWVSLLPTIGAFLLFANFILELSYALSAGQATAVAAFVHMLAGLLALHCFDLRSRTDFSVSALIGLGLLTFLTGVARDLIFGAYVMIYTVLGGMLLFFDSSSRSHEIGPSRAVAEAQIEGQPMIRRLRVASLTAMLPIFLIPLVTAATCFVLPKGESVIELFVDSFRAQFPLSATMSGYLSRGGRSQSVQGGVAKEKKEGGASYSAKGGQGQGTASSAGTPGANSNAKGNSGSGAGSGSTGAPTAANPNGTGSAIPGLNGKKTNFDISDIKANQALVKAQALDRDYDKQTVDIRGAASDQERVILKVGSQNPTYIRRYTLDVFDGNGWSRKMPVPAKEIEANKLGFDLTASNAVYVPTDLPTEEITQDFRTEVPMGTILPHTWMPQVVKIDGEKVRMDSDGTIKLPAPLAERAHYTVTSQVPVYDLEMMRRLPSETLLQLDEDRDDELKTAQACLQLPANLDKRIKDMAADAGGIEGNWFSKAERTAEYVKGHYHYNKHSFLEETAQAPTASSETAPEQISPSPSQAPAPAPAAPTAASQWDAIRASNEPVKKVIIPPVKPANDEMAALNTFLFQTKVGNCRHFATTFALLCRAQGIPARLVEGFLPGEMNKKTGYREIRGKDTHVWVEVYIPYWNWVPFDPTPEGALPAHQEGGNALTKFIASGLANPFGQNVNRHSAPKSDRNNMRGDNRNQPKPEEKKPGAGAFDFDAAKNKPKGSTFSLPWLGTVDQTQMQSVVKFFAVIILLLVLVVATLVYLKQKKRRRVEAIEGDQPPSTVMFLEVLSELKRYEFTKMPTETADELSDRARTQFAQLVHDGRHVPRELPEVVSQFMQLYTEERFGGGENLDEMHELSKRIKSLSHSKAAK